MENPVTRVLREGAVVGLANHTLLIARDGTERPIDDSAAPIRDRSGNIAGVVMVFHDVTERRRAETALEEANAQLEERVRERTAEVVQKPTRNIRPSSIRASSAGLLTLDGTVLEANRCQKIIQELLQFARPSSAEFCLVDAKPIIEKTINLVANHLYKQKIEAATLIDENLPKLFADPQQIEQVLVNLYLNAIDAMPDGGKLMVAAKMAPLDGSARMLVVTATDTGFGIEESDLAKVFQPFFSAKKGRGMGLGLSISERIIKNHGGKIHVESEAGQGTTFRIYLPLDHQAQESNSVAES